MPQVDISFDYLELLGVAAGEVATLGVAGLRELIKKKKKEWTAKEINPLYQQEARLHKERIQAFEELLNEPDALAAYVRHIHEIQIERKARQETEFRRIVAVTAAGKREISPRQRELLKHEARKQQLPEAVVDAAIQAMGLAVRSGEAPTAAKPVVPRLAPAMDRVVLTEINNWLKILGKPTLYALLDLTDQTAPNQLISTAKVLYARWSKVLPKSSECTAWEKTLQACLTYLRDAAAKVRYDHALFNERIDQFVRHVDLALAGTKFGKEEQQFLTRLSVEDFGFTAKLANDCILARAADKGVAIHAGAPVSIRLEGQIQCRACFAWNEPRLHKSCRQCGSSLFRKCSNPSCAGTAPANAHSCPRCNLSFHKGRRYVALLELADTCLNRGSVRGAMGACELARQLLPGPAIDQRLARAQQLNHRIGSLKNAVARKAWFKAADELQHLIELAPRFRQSGIPKLEDITNYMAAVQAKFAGISPDADAADTAKIYLACLTQWTDCAEAQRKVRQLCRALEEEQRPRTAGKLARKLMEICGPEKDLELLAARLDEATRQAEAVKEQSDEASRALAAAVAENRLYAAEKLLRFLEQLDRVGPEPVAAKEVRRRLEEVRSEVQRIQHLAAATTERDPLIQSYYNVLERCRDCREALVALQSLTPDPPAAPRQLTVKREGQRRYLSWEAAETGKRPTAYVVQRSMTRPGARPGESPYQVIYEGPACHFNDDESAPCGTILRYSVCAVVSGRLEAEGNILQEYQQTSPSTSAAGMLLWQEVLNLRSVRGAQCLQLSWDQPSGARQVLIKRWPGGPEDGNGPAVILPPSGRGTLVDGNVPANQVYTYRVSCVYDGPEGEFTTPGVLCTDAISQLNPQANGVVGQEHSAAVTLHASV